MKMNKLYIFIVALAITASPMMADLTYTTPSNFISDKVAASAQATFTVIDSTHLQLVLSNTTMNPFEDSQNVSAISFKLANGSTAVTGTLTSMSGDSISSTPENTNVLPLVTTGGASLATTPWTNPPAGTGNPDNALTQPGTISYFAKIGTPGFSTEMAKYSIVGIPNASNQYTPNYITGCTQSTGTQQNCGTSLEFGQNSADNPMIYEKATFVFSLSSALSGSLTNAVSGTCTAGKTCIDSVEFGFGPDGPDGSDVTAGVFSSSQNPTPEPAYMTTLLILSGLVVFLHRRRQRTALNITQQA